MAVFPADKLDLLCWQLINETPLYLVLEDKLSKNQIKIKAIADMIKENPLGIYNFSKISQNIGMALPTFRRHWLKYIGVAPARYIADLRLGLSCDLLIKSDKNINEIATELKFQDSLYFSRFFKKKTGLSPKVYRNTYSFTN